MSNVSIRGRRWPVDPFTRPGVYRHGRSTWLIAGMVPLIALAVVLPAPWPAAAWPGGKGSDGWTPGGGGPAALLDSVVLAVASGLVWALLAWTVLVALAGTLSRRPGRCGLVAERVLRRVAPAAARQLFVASVGVSLIGGMTGCSATAPAAGMATSGLATFGSSTVSGGASGISTVTVGAPRDCRADISMPPVPARGIPVADVPVADVLVADVPVADVLVADVPVADVSVPGLPVADVAAPEIPDPAAVESGVFAVEGSAMAPGGPVGWVPSRSRWVHPARVVDGTVRGIDVDWPGPVAGFPVLAPVVVHRGDTLWAIAARHLGGRPSDAQIDASWRTWYAANRAVIGDDPNLILPGQQLRPPAVPAVLDGGS